MDRRGFLRSLLTGAAALTLDPERLLWVPGAKTISIPKAIEPVSFGGVKIVTCQWMPNSEIIFLQIEKIRPQLEELFTCSDVWSELLA